MVTLLLLLLHDREEEGSITDDDDDSSMRKEKRDERVFLCVSFFCDLFLTRERTRSRGEFF